MQENSQRQIKLFWTNRDGSTSPDSPVIMTHDPSHSTNPLVPDTPAMTSLWYDVPTVIVNATQSVSNFWFEIDEGNGTSTTKNQGGAGYALSDAVMVSNSTCLDFSDPSSTKVSLTFVVSSYILFNPPLS